MVPSSFVTQIEIDFRNCRLAASAVEKLEEVCMVVAYL